MIRNDVASYFEIVADLRTFRSGFEQTVQLSLTNLTEFLIAESLLKIPVDIFLQKNFFR